MGEFGLTPSEGVDRVDVAPDGLAFGHRVGDLLAVGRVGRIRVVLVVVGELGLSTPTDFDLVDVALGIITLQAFKAREGDPCAIGRKVGGELVVVVVGELGLIPSAGVDRVDLSVRVGV